MPSAYVTRIVEFTATHRLPRTDFGAAAKDHSHRYQCRVTVKGPLRPAAGGVASLQALDALLRREVVEPFDGKHINQDVEAFADGQWLPTGEALAVYFWKRLEDKLPAGARLHAVRVQESDHLYSEYFGEP